MIDLAAMKAALASARTIQEVGRIHDLAPLSLRGPVPGARLGEQVEVEADGGMLQAEVVAVRGDEAWLVPLGDPGGVPPGARAWPTGRGPTVGVGVALLGRVLDGLGRPIDGGAPPRGLVPWAVDRAPPAPMSRPRLQVPFVTGVRALDGLALLAEGQRIGLFAGPGAGKSSLLGRLARSSGADVAVIGLVGERGREVREMVEESLGEEGRARSVVVVATSDEPPIVRARAARVATAIAEWFARVRGKRVLLLLDSLTRFARALREVGLAAGEPPVRQGFPARVFVELPRLLERAGAGPGGPITAVYTVLGHRDAAEDPLGAEVRGLLDGHVTLDEAVAAAGRYPAIDVLATLSRTMRGIASPRHRAAADRVRDALARWEAGKELVAAGAWRPGADRALDRAVERVPAIEAFLRQGAETSTLEETVEALDALVQPGDAGGGAA